MPNEDATLVPYKTLCLLNNTLSHRAISVYVYLLKRYWAEGQKEYIVTMKNLKNYLGLSVNTQSNDYIITNILFVLEKIGLVITELRQIDEQTTYRYVLAVRNWLWDIAK